jgi:hypothetical protein
MKRLGLLLIAISFVLSGCGKKGPLLAPFVRIPQKPSTPVLVQLGGKILVSWKNPSKYVDGSDLDKVAEIGIWVLEVPKTETSAVLPSLSEFSGRAGRIAVVKNEELPTYSSAGKESGEEEFVYPYVPGEGKAGKSRFIFALRAKDARNRESDFTELASADFGICPLAPPSLDVRSLEGRIEVAWKEPEANIDGSKPPLTIGYNVYRQKKDGPPVLLNTGLVRLTKFEDKNFPYGESLRYWVRASALETKPFLESEDSPIRDVVPKDVFPPAAPAGVVPIAGKGFIALSWEANKEKDLAGYRVRRRGEKEIEILLLTPEPIAECSYTDRTVVKGRIYRYSITSMDKNGNESAAVEIRVESLKDDPS